MMLQIEKYKYNTDKKSKTQQKSAIKNQGGLKKLIDWMKILLL